MQPETVHLIAQLIRHERGTLTAIDRWIKAQEQSESLRELQQVLETRRSMLLICERQLAAHDGTDSRGSDNGSAQRTDAARSPDAPHSPVTQVTKGSRHGY